MASRKIRNGLYYRRKAANAVALLVSVLMTLFGLFWLLWLLWTLFDRGASYLRWHVFLDPTPPPGEMGGLANAIVGSVLLVVVGTVAGVPVGVLAGTWLSEFSAKSRVASIIRFVNDVLLSAPSIIIGVFVYEAVVVRVGHFSGWAGGLALALIMFPIIVRTTEDMLRVVPATLREAAVALGAPAWKVTLSVVFRSARSGIMTGVLLAIARVSGETAPLLFTSLNNQFWSRSLNEPLASLPVVIFQFAMSPYEDWQHLAWTGALLITLGVLSINILARVGLRGGK